MIYAQMREKWDWRRNTVIAWMFQVNFPVLQCCTINSIFSSPSNFRKINEFGLEINWFGWIHLAMRKPKANQIYNPHKPQFNFSFWKEESNNNRNQICSYISTKQLCSTQGTKTPSGNQHDNWGSGKSDIQPNCCSVLYLFSISRWSTVTNHFKWTLKN